MDFFYDAWVEYWFDAPVDDGGCWGDYPDYVLQGPQLPYYYRESFAPDGSMLRVSREPDRWIPSWQQLTWLADGIYRDCYGDHYGYDTIDGLGVIELGPYS